MTMYYIVYALTAMLLLALSLATTPTPRSVPIIVAAALLWPLIVASVCVHVMAAKMIRSRAVRSQSASPLNANRIGQVL